MTGEIVEDRGQEARQAGSLPHAGRIEARKRRESLDSLGVLGNMREGRDGDLHGLVAAGRSGAVSVIGITNFQRVGPSRSDGATAEITHSRTVFMPDASTQKTVLIVEDNELNMKLFNDLLEAHGYRTIQTRSGNEALDLARSNRINLILMDIQLPGVSGLEVIRWLKDDETLRTIPVVAITAFAMKGDEEKIRQGGCEAYLSKPISVVKFLETVGAYASEN